MKTLESVVQKLEKPTDIVDLVAEELDLLASKFEVSRALSTRDFTNAVWPKILAFKAEMVKAAEEAKEETLKAKAALRTAVQEKHNKGTQMTADEFAEMLAIVYEEIEREPVEGVKLLTAVLHDQLPGLLQHVVHVAASPDKADDLIVTQVREPMTLRRGIVALDKVMDKVFGPSTAKVEVKS